MESKRKIFEYYRTKRGLAGVVCAIDNGVLGWSLCRKKDRFSKEGGLDRAIKRAEKANRLSNDPMALVDYYSRVPHSLKALWYKMMERSEDYYKK